MNIALKMAPGTNSSSRTASFMSKAEYFISVQSRWFQAAFLSWLRQIESQIFYSLMNIVTNFTIPTNFKAVQGSVMVP